jgi:hypothetical protein
MPPVHILGISVMDVFLVFVDTRESRRSIEG